MSKQLFSEFHSGSLHLPNRLVMAPMTRNRATGNIPNELMAEYYSQRAAAGLIITEGTSPSDNGLGYPDIPGIFSQDQIEGWKKVTEAVHKKNGRIFLQTMHTGRVGHSLNLQNNTHIIGASEIPAKLMITTKEGKLNSSIPQKLTEAGIEKIINDHVQAAINAMEAGFDGIELHAAHGYLIEQFLNPVINNRDDEYGGKIENRAKFLMKITEKAAAAIGAQRIGVRVSPYSTLNDIPSYEDIENDYTFIAEALNKQGINYLHISKTAGIEDSVITKIRSEFKNTLIICGGITPEKGEELLKENKADLIGMGMPFLANPDLVHRLKINAPLNPPDVKTFYTPGSKGYTDYPALA